RDIGTPYKHELLSKVGLIFSISSLANVAWIFSWHNFMIPFSMLWMIIILLCLITIMQTINKEQLSRREKLLVKLPFSVYFGWITVATIANATGLLVSLKWNGWGIAESIWAVIIIIIGMLIGAATTIKNRDIAYGLVIVWAYIGIYIKHTSATGFAGQYPVIINTVIACIVLLLAVLAYVLITWQKQTH
ncbi:MAG TPA: tryptophan-rich sensory protein, partial [Syntrophomonas sp.]|nr:tryptophan-rich sensory protein [Syntrophomonas sp.]